MRIQQCIVLLPPTAHHSLHTHILYLFPLPLLLHNRPLSHTNLHTHTFTPTPHSHAHTHAHESIKTYTLTLTLSLTLSAAPRALELLFDAHKDHESHMISQVQNQNQNQNPTQGPGQGPNPNYPQKQQNGSQVCNWNYMNKIDLNEIYEVESCCLIVFVIRDSVWFGWLLCCGWFISLLDITLHAVIDETKNHHNRKDKTRQLSSEVLVRNETTVLLKLLFTSSTVYENLHHHLNVIMRSLFILLPILSYPILYHYI